MYRVMVFYDEEPDGEAYDAHAEVCHKVPGGVFRHGKVLGSPRGEAPHAYYAEWEFADKDAFENATKSEEFMASGQDARDRGLPRPSIEFAEID